MTDPQVVAMLEVVWTQPTGEVVPLLARLGVPVVEPSGEWTCHMQIVGLDPAWRGIHGIDSFQALALAMRLVRTRLGHLIADGGQLHMPGVPHDALDPTAIAALFGVDTAGAAP